MIDLHSHILPYIDDGADDWEQALAMVRVASADGVTDIVCTPHWVPGQYDNRRPSILEKTGECREKLAAAGIDMRIYPGAELRLDISMPDRIKNGDLLTINDTGVYALIELPDSVLPDHLDEFFWELEIRGIKPILSHVERNAALRQDPSRLYRWVDMGYLAQVTAASLVDGFTPDVRDFAQLLLEHRLVHILVSDSHGLRTRTPKLSDGLAAAGKIIGERAAQRMVSDIPALVLQGKPVEIPDPIPIQKKKTFFDFFRR